MLIAGGIFVWIVMAWITTVWYLRSYPDYPFSEASFILPISLIGAWLMWLPVLITEWAVDYGRKKR